MWIAKLLPAFCGYSRHGSHVVCSALLCSVLITCGGSGADEADRARVEQGVTPLVSQADRSRKVGDYDSAIEAYRRAYERTPWNDRLKRALAVTYTERAQRVRDEGSLPKAERDLREAVSLFPEDPNFQRNLAVILLERAQAAPDEASAAQWLDEARRLDPNLPVPEQMVNLPLERRLNMAFELLERNQLEAGIGELEVILREHPDNTEAIRLIAQAKLNLADGFARRNNLTEAGRLFDEVVSLYARLEPCDGTRCTSEELRTAHYNRCVLFINAREDDRARSALEDARAHGFRFTDLEQALKL